MFSNSFDCLSISHKCYHAHFVWILMQMVMWILLSISLHVPLLLWIIEEMMKIVWSHYKAEIHLTIDLSNRLWCFGVLYCFLSDIIQWFQFNSMTQCMVYWFIQFYACKLVVTDVLWNLVVWSLLSWLLWYFVLISCDSVYILFTWNLSWNVGSMHLFTTTFNNWTTDYFSLMEYHKMQQPLAVENQSLP